MKIKKTRVHLGIVWNAAWYPLPHAPALLLDVSFRPERAIAIWNKYGKSFSAKRGILLSSRAADLGSLHYLNFGNYKKFI